MAAGIVVLALPAAAVGHSSDYKGHERSGDCRTGWGSHFLRSYNIYDSQSRMNDHYHVYSHKQGGFRSPPCVEQHQRTVYTHSWRSSSTDGTAVPGNPVGEPAGSVLPPDLPPLQ